MGAEARQQRGISMTIRIFGDSISGNCLKVKFVCDLLRIPYQWEEVDILKGESRTPAFLAMNPAGQVPVGSAERRPGGRAVERHHALSGGGLRPHSRRCFRPREDDGMVVLGAIQSRTRTSPWRGFRWYISTNRSAGSNPALVERGNAALARLETALRAQRSSLATHSHWLISRWSRTRGWRARAASILPLTAMSGPG